MRCFSFSWQDKIKKNLFLQNAKLLFLKPTRQLISFYFIDLKRSLQSSIEIPNVLLNFGVFCISFVPKNKKKVSMYWLFFLVYSLKIKPFIILAVLRHNVKQICPVRFYVFAPEQHSFFRRHAGAVASRWQHCVSFDRPEIWTSDLPLQRRTRYQSTNWLHLLNLAFICLAMLFVSYFLWSDIFDLRNWSNFHETYFLDSSTNFWVAVDSSKKEIVGTIGISLPDALLVNGWPERENIFKRLQIKVSDKQQQQHLNR